jgi:hypothetical protein
VPAPLTFSRNAPRLLALLVLVAALGWARAWGPAEEGFFDSAFYLDGARHLAQGEGFVSAAVANADGHYAPVIRWAPGFSALMALPIACGVAPLRAAAWVLGAAYASAITAVFLLGIELTGRRHWPSALLASICFGAQPSVLEAMDALLSDLPCAAASLWAVLLAIRLARNSRATLPQRLAFGVTLALLVLLRYAGLFFAIGLLLALAIVLRRSSLLRRLAPSVVVMGLGVGAWMLRNRSLGSGAFGERLWVQTDPAQQLQRASTGLLTPLRELIDRAESEPLQLYTSWLLFAAAACFLALLVRNWAHARRKLLLLLLPMAAYFAALVTTATFMHFDPIDNPRFWIALWPLLVCLVLTPTLQASRSWWLLAHAVVLGALLWSAGLFATRAAQGVGTAHRYRGLLDARWQRAADVLPAPGECQLFVNDPRPFMLHRALGPTPTIPPSLEELQAETARFARVCIATVGRGLRLSSSAERRRVDQTRAVRALAALGRLDLVARGAGVSVYRVRER